MDGFQFTFLVDHAGVSLENSAAIVENFLLRPWVISDRMSSKTHHCPVHSSLLLGVPRSLHVWV